MGNSDIVLAWDILGTVVNQHRVVEKVRPVLGDKAVELCNLWLKRSEAYT